MQIVRFLVRRLILRFNEENDTALFELGLDLTVTSFIVVLTYFFALLIMVTMVSVVTNKIFSQSLVCQHDSIKTNC